MSNRGRTLVALGAATLALVVAAWFDSTYLRDAMRNAQANFDTASRIPLFVLGSLLVAGAVLLLGVLAWRAGSPVVSVPYIVVGVFFVGLPWIVLSLAPSTNVLPESFASALGSIWYSTMGKLNAVGTIGAGMLIAGIAALRPWWRGRTVAAGPTETVTRTLEPTIP